jgi:hypothetical protein
MTQCSSDGKWCCGYIPPLPCCSDSSRFAVNQTIGVSSTTFSVGSSSTIAITSSTTLTSQTTTAMTTPSTTPQSTGGNRMSKEPQVGIGICVGVRVPIHLVIAFIPWCLRRWRNKADAPTDPSGTRSSINSAFYGYKHELEAKNSRLNDMFQKKFGYSQMSELNAEPVIYEVGTSRWHPSFFQSNEIISPMKQILHNEIHQPILFL